MERYHQRPPYHDYCNPLRLRPYVGLHGIMVLSSEETWRSKSMRKGGATERFDLPGQGHIAQSCTDAITAILSGFGLM